MLLEKEMGVLGVGGEGVVMRGGGWWGVVGCEEGGCFEGLFKHGWGGGLAARV